MRKKGKHGGKKHGAPNGQNANPVQSSSDDWDPPTPPKPAVALFSAVHLVMIKDMLERFIRQAHEFLETAVPRIRDGTPRNSEEFLALCEVARAQLQVFAKEAWKLSLEYSQWFCSKLLELSREYSIKLFAFSKEAKVYLDIFLRDTSEFLARHFSRSWPKVQRLLMTGLQLALLAALMAVDAVVRCCLSLCNLGFGAILFIFWSLLFGLASCFGWVIFTIVFVSSVVWCMFVSVWIPLFVAGLLAVWGAFQNGLVYSSVATAIGAGGCLFLKRSDFSMGTVLLYAVVETYVNGGFLRIFLCFLFSAVSIQMLHYYSSKTEPGGFQWTWEARFATSKKGSTSSTSGWSAANLFGSGNPKAEETKNPSSNQSGQEAMEDEEEDTPNSDEGKDMSPEMVARREITRILRCKHHYAVLEIELYTEVEPTKLKKDYRKKAIMVHPDKNSTNEKRAREAFQSLQSAYEVVSDPVKKKEYDDELRHKLFIEMLQQRAKESTQNPASTSGQGSGIASPEGTKRMGCSHCGGSHTWLPTTRRKQQARWCQECNTYHPAKEGEGWMERHPVPGLFGILSGNGPIQAFTLSDGKVYDITEWVECQGLRCSVNTHKPTFHYKTRFMPPPATSPTRGSSPRTQPFSPTNSSGSQGPDGKEELSEEEILDFLAEAVNSGALDPEALLEALKRGSFDAAAAAEQQRRSKPSAKKRGKGKGHR